MSSSPKTPEVPEVPQGPQGPQIDPAQIELQAYRAIAQLNSCVKVLGDIVQQLMTGKAPDESNRKA